MKNKMGPAKSSAFRRAGFTLFELLVSISIIAILTALATVSYSNAQKKARDARRVQDMDMMRKANEMYYSKNNYQYATVGTDLTDATDGTIERIPNDPKNIAPNVYSLTYAADTYCFCSRLENTGGGNSTDAACAVGAGDYYCVKNQQ